jgi:arylsulfatase A-like enzyme
MDERPNFLFIITDQHRADHLGCYGNTLLRTSNIDGLAARGTLFERCYVASPVCMPNRATWLTGRMPSLHGVRSNGIPLHFSNVTFPELLRASGYRTALVGKSHLQNMTERPPARGPLDAAVAHMGGLDEATRARIDTADYEQERPSRWRDPSHHIETPYYGFDEVQLCNGHGDDTFGDYERWATLKEPLLERLRGRVHATADSRYATPQAWRTRVPEELYSTHYIAERAVEWLDRHARHRASEPFFLVLSFPDPHHPFTPPGRYWDLYDPADVAAPRTCGAPGDGTPAHVQWLHAQRASGRAVLDTAMPFAVTPREACEAIALTYGMIAMIDERIGRVLATLQGTDLAPHTVVVFTSDHGDFMGDHGLMLKGAVHYQGLIRVPLIWAEPQGRSATRCFELAATLDIGPTVLARAGIAAPNGMQGRTLPGAGSDAGAPEPDSILIEEDTQAANLGFDHPIRVRTLVTKRFRLSLYLGTEWGELYDLAEDPHEERNLWNDGTTREIRSSLILMLTQKMMTMCDRSPLATARA